MRQRNGSMRLILLTLLCFTAQWCCKATAAADQSQCDTPLEQSFSSGAQWTLCATVHEQHGLELSSIAYRAPGDSSRSVLSLIHLGQVLMHYHDSRDAQPQLNVDTALIPLNNNSCPAVVNNTSLKTAAFCSELKDNGTLAKYSQRPSLHSKRLVLSSAFSQGSLVWTVSYALTEDGQIRSSLRLSGRASQRSDDERYAQTLTANETGAGLSRATVLANWRMVFDLDTAANDRIEAFEFPLDIEHGNRRPMQISPIDTESLHSVNRASFRGWRVVDNSGAGYYLDPANSGFAYNSHSLNWAQFDLAVTAYKPCEVHALLNPGRETTCAQSLDNFINGESLAGKQPVLWHNQTRTFNPGLESWPIIRDIDLSFDLLPFDWTATSPFNIGY